MDKLVSIIIPTFKRPDKLSRAIDSVLNQTYKNIEIIVVDDNFPDSKERTETELVMKKYSDNSKVKYFKHSKNMNGSAARNTGIKYSNGEYIMFLDDDDEFMQNKIMDQIKCLEAKDLSWGACYTDHIKKRNGKCFSRSLEKREGNLLLEELKRNLFIAAGSNLMIRRSVVEELKGFDESFVRNQDQEFLTRLLIKYKLAHVGTIGLIIHQDDQINKNKVDFDDLTDQYLNSFDKVISRLKTEERNAVYRMINLQRFRHKIFHPKKIGQALDMIKNREVKPYDAICYIMHLIYRKIAKVSVGFETNKKF